MKLTVFVLASVLFISGCPLESSAHRGKTSKWLTVECITDYLKEGADVEVIEIGQSSAEVKILSTMVTVTFSEGKFRAEATSEQQKFSLFRKPGALSKAVNALGKNIDANCPRS